MVGKKLILGPNEWRKGSWVNDFCIRPMTDYDIDTCVDVHICSFQGFFLTFLGERFLRELYLAIRQDPQGIAFVAEENDSILGFVVGATCVSGLYRRLLRKRVFRFAWASAGAFFKRPQILPRLLRAFSAASEKDPAENCGTLMSIAVLPETQGRGVGKYLVQAFLAEAHRRGLENVILNTDRDHNESTNAFYLRQGFSLLRSYATPEGRWMNQYIIPLNVPAVAGAAA